MLGRALDLMRLVFRLSKGLVNPVIKDVSDAEHPGHVPSLRKEGNVSFET